ncbi:hypothetical protein COOONC_24546 [Cooperia oncophora]
MGFCSVYVVSAPIWSIGAPYVYTVNYNDTDQLLYAVRQALKEQPQPFVPEEFTPRGMLIRVNMLIHRDLCASALKWPPHSALEACFFLLSVIMVRRSDPGESCEMACNFAGLVCEPSFFPLVNSVQFLTSEPHAPYNCIRQASSLMFSCATRPPAGTRAATIIGLEVAGEARQNTV